MVIEARSGCRIPALLFRDFFPQHCPLLATCSVRPKGGLAHDKILPDADQSTMPRAEIRSSQGESGPIDARAKRLKPGMGVYRPAAAMRARQDAAAAAAPSEEDTGAQQRAASSQPTLEPLALGQASGQQDDKGIPMEDGTRAQHGIAVEGDTGVDGGALCATAGGAGCSSVNAMDTKDDRSQEWGMVEPRGDFSEFQLDPVAVASWADQAPATYHCCRTSTCRAEPISSAGIVVEELALPRRQSESDFVGPGVWA